MPVPVLAAGRARSISTFVAYVLADNRRMLDVLTRFTDVVRSSIESGVVTVHFMPRAVPPLPLAQMAHG